MKHLNGALALIISISLASPADAGFFDWGRKKPAPAPIGAVVVEITGKVEFQGKHDEDWTDAQLQQPLEEGDMLMTDANGAVVGNLDVPLTERSNVHGGFQAMPYSYDNNFKTSEATLTLARRDWTAEGVTKLSLWFRGDGANAAERMFVALNGNAVVYNDDANATQTAGWTEWVIDLQAFAGVNLSNVSTITIGFGAKGSPAAGGGTGTVHFDDIRLIR